MMPQMAAASRTPTQSTEPTAAAPPQPSPPTSPPGQPTGSQRTPPPPPPPPPPPVDGKAFYGYLYKKDKTPTALLNALLRAIGKHIETEIGDKSHTLLDKAKLAAFYKAVGGDYDILFVRAPDKSISYIWQALGVQHSLQPTENDFAEPSVPALTLKGFVRWQSIQILLEPQDHVPFMQFAVRNWALRHPDSGVPFPPDLPSTAFPAVCDPQIDEWHKNCAKSLRSEAVPAERPAPAAAPDPRIHVHFNHVRPGGFPRHGPAMDYFDRERTRVPYVHVPGRHTAAAPHHSESPHSKHRLNSSGSGSSMDERARRRSFSDYPSPTQDMRSSGRHDPRRAPPTDSRRHSHPRPESHSDIESDSEGPQSPRSRGHRPVRPPAASVRVFPPDAPRAHQGGQAPSRAHRAELRQYDSRRRSVPSGGLGFRQKITSLSSSLFPGSHDRARSTSRSDRDSDSRPNSARMRSDAPTSRPGHRWPEDTWSSDESDSEVSPKHRHRRDPARMADLLREREERERERKEDERERRSRKDPAHLRPNMTRRTSSAADVERFPREWDARDRYRDRDRDRGREHRDSRDPRTNLTGDESERRSWRDKERRRERDRERAASPVVGVSGRKYPTENLKPEWA